MEFVKIFSINNKKVHPEKNSFFSILWKLFWNIKNDKTITKIKSTLMWDQNDIGLENLSLKNFPPIDKKRLTSIKKNIPNSSLVEMNKSKDFIRYKGVFTKQLFDFAFSMKIGENLIFIVETTVTQHPTSNNLNIDIKVTAKVQNPVSYSTDYDYARILCSKITDEYFKGLINEFNTFCQHLFVSLEARFDETISQEEMIIVNIPKNYSNGNIARSIPPQLSPKQRFPCYLKSISGLYKPEFVCKFDLLDLYLIALVNISDIEFFDENGEKAYKPEYLNIQDIRSNIIEIARIIEKRNNKEPDNELIDLIYLQQPVITIGWPLLTNNTTFKKDYKEILSKINWSTV